MAHGNTVSTCIEQFLGLDLWLTGNLINIFRNRIVRQSCRKSNRLSIIIILYENENKKKMLHKHRYIHIVVNSDEELDFVKNCYC